MRLSRLTGWVLCVASGLACSATGAPSVLYGFAPDAKPRLISKPDEPTAQKRRTKAFQIERDPETDVYFVRCSLRGKNGKMDTRLAFDTGCSWLILSEIAVNTLGLDPTSTAAGSAKQLKDKDSEDKSVVLDSLTVGGVMSFQKPPAYPWNTKIVRQMGGDLVDGILGLYLFGVSSLLMDFQRGVVSVYYPSALSAEELKAAGMDDALEIPIEVEDYQVYVTADLGNGIKEKLKLDTGAVRTGVSSDVARKANVKKTSRQKMGTAFGIVNMAQGQLPRMSIGPLNFERVAIEYPDKKQIAFPPHLGLDILSSYRILLDVPNKKLLMKLLPRAEPKT